MNLALCPINPTVGDISGNVALVIQAAQEAAAAGARVAVFPELALCGYPPRDLLLQNGFVTRCEAASRSLMEAAARLNMLIIAGTPRRTAAGAVTNALAVAQPGTGQIQYYDKQLLPTYDVFDEDRYFVSGTQPAIITYAGMRIGLTICEDLWRGEDAGFASRYQDAPDPVAQLMARGVDLIVSPSASPFVLGKNGKHRTIVAGHALRHGITVASVNQLGGNDDLVFDGHAFCYDPRGELCYDGPLFTGGITYVTVPPTDSRPKGVAPQSLESDLFAALRLGVKDYLRKCGFTRAVLGLSGGIDSALTAAIACAAIGPENVTGVMMPSKYSSEHSIGDARQLAANLGMRCELLPIASCVQTASSSINALFATLDQPALGATLPDITEENLQSRVRGTLLMAVSNRTGAIVLTTGNKSEMAVGYCTLYGDMNGGLAVLSDVNKQWVYALSRWLNLNYAHAGFGVPPIPESSIMKPPSAELRPDQTDQDSLPPYDILDALIDGYVQERRSPQQLIEAGFDAALVKRITRMIDLAEYKRKQAAVGLKVTAVAFGPGRRWPIAWRRGE